MRLAEVERDYQKLVKEKSIELAETFRERDSNMEQLQEQIKQLSNENAQMRVNNSPIKQQQS